MKTLVLCACALIIAMTALAEESAPPIRVYDHLLDPAAHLDYERRHVQPPTWDTFGNRTRFVTLRGFGMDNDRIVGFEEELEKYTITHRLGDVIWPSYPIVFAENLDELADAIKRRDLVLFDIWGYVPGSGPGGYWQQFHPPAGVFDMLESKLGERWLGMDVGEQDGRYVGGYASQMYPISGDRVAQYLNFQRHFQAMTDELGNRMSTLVSLNFGHYFLKEGVYTTIGAETAQGLPNGQVYYSFIRGAGKQYGVPWFGNASVWNRWGYKNYAAEGDDHGATKGTSLSLLKRLLYSHILYNCVFVGYESGWFVGDELTPIGRMQQAAREWVVAHGQPGTMMTPIAVMTDFYSGWSFPRHLYTDNVCRVWGNLPYEPGDYLTDNVLDLFYPGYQDSSFFHDETGFVVPTPHGDSVDCLLSDAPNWVLAQYPLLIVADELRGGAELRDKLNTYIEQGGHLVITAGSLANFPGGLGGIRATGSPVRVGAATVTGDFGTIEEPASFDLYRLESPNATVVQHCQPSSTSETIPAAVQTALGNGRLTVLASPFGLAAAPREDVIHNDIDKAYVSPYPMLAHVRAILSGLARQQSLFEVPEGLSLITCRRAPGEYTLALCNNALVPKPFDIISHCGPIESIEELPLDQSEKGAMGYLPTGLDGTDVGTSTDSTIAGGDVRIFRVTVREERVEEIPAVVPPPRPQGRILPLRGPESIQDAVLTRPTFFQHFDSVAVDWRYVYERDASQLAREAGWIQRQGLTVYVDLTSGINLYPDLRLVNNDPDAYAESMRMIDEVLEKMSALGAKHLILSLHRVPENNFTREQTEQSFDETLKNICASAEPRGITVYLRQSPKAGDRLEAIVERIARIGAPNLRWAASTALLLHQNASPAGLTALLNGRPGLWLASAPAYDIAGKPWTMNAPLEGNGDPDTLAQLLSAAPSAPVLLDAVYNDWDAEYRDARCLPDK
ncbi:MAG: hypothetical protein AMXMBFR82_46140 [Candidatus Hydrogenedentota bacterium]